MKKTFLAGRLRGAARGLALAAGLLPALAQAQAPAEALPASPARAPGSARPPMDLSAADTNSLELVIVTGAAEPAGLRKLDASYSVTTASLAEVQAASPGSSADMLKIVPGIWAESSGGQTGANIELAGFPGGADAPYVSYLINGAPVFPVPSLAFMDNASLFRLDETMERVEVVQGGPAVVLANGQIGATVNVRLREGTAKAQGDVAVTYGSEGLKRLDGFYGGPLAPSWYFSFGGFYRESPGIRRSQFPADLGGQWTATLAHDWDRGPDSGSSLFYARVLDDRNLFVTDLPVDVSANGRSVGAFAGFDPQTGTFAGNALRELDVQEFPGATPGTINADLADGRGASVRLLGWDLDAQAGAWSLANKAGYTAGEVPTRALFNNFAPQSLGQFVAGQVAAANANGPVLGAAGRAASAGTATWVDGGGAVDLDTAVASVGFWVVDKQVQSLTDELRLTRDLFAGNSLTAGAYVARYRANDRWFLGNNLLVSATPNAQPINLALDNGVQVTRNGYLGGSTYSLVDGFTGLNHAIFVSDQWRVGAWLLDAGVRREWQRLDGVVENQQAEDLDANPLTLYNNQVMVAGGGWNALANRAVVPAWSAGMNREVDDRASVFVRINQGHHLPTFDDLRNGLVGSQQISNLEFGYRLQAARVIGVIDVFHRNFRDVPYQQFLADGSSASGSYGARSSGIEFEGRWVLGGGFNFDATGDWQHAAYVHDDSVTLAGTGINGNELQRQPRLQFRLTPNYVLATTWGQLRAQMTLSHVAQRYSDIANTQILPSYDTLDAGIVATIDPALEIRLQGSNLTNTLGLTEGNARVTDSGIANGFEMARPIFGRELLLQLRYSF